MFENIEVEENGRTNIAIEGLGCDIVVRRSNGTNGEIVIYQGARSNLNVRFARTPYSCRLFLADNEKYGTEFDVDLSDTDDWSNIQQMNPDDKFAGGSAPEDWADRIGWGNDDEGHVEIVKVELLDRYPHGTEVPLETFKRDLSDFIIYHEG